MVSWALGCQRCPRRQKGAKNVPKVRKTHPFWRAFWTPFRHYFYFGPPGRKKRGSGSAFKTRPLFLSILGSPRRASGGFPSPRELSFHIYSRSQKGLQNESQNGAFWAPKSPLYSLWGTLGEKWVPQKGCQKRFRKTAKN